MSGIGILIVLGSVIAPLIIAILVGAKATRWGCRISGVLLLLLVATFVVLSVQPRSVERFMDNQALSIPGDYQDHVEYGRPLGFWRRFPETAWNTMQNQLDLRGLIVDGIFWGYFVVVVMVPAFFQLIRNRHRTAANQPSQPIAGKPGSG